VRYLALLRGINVGGKNKVPMAELKATFEDAGFDAVRTYIQSGNVLFDSGPKVEEDALEAVLERRFELPLVVVLRTSRQLRAVVESAPDGFGQRPDEFHSDVVFLKAPLTSRQAMKAVELKDGVDSAWPGRGVLYMQRLSARLTSSRLNRIASTPEYKAMTIRNWRTTTKLHDLLD
jgi:uncharacterized protein (DUF1697 family)